MSSSVLPKRQVFFFLGILPLGLAEEGEHRSWVKFTPRILSLHCMQPIPLTHRDNPLSLTLRNKNKSLRLKTRLNDLLGGIFLQCSIKFRMTWPRAFKSLVSNNPLPWIFIVMEYKTHKVIKSYFTAVLRSRSCPGVAIQHIFGGQRGAITQPRRSLQQGLFRQWAERKQHLLLLPWNPAPWQRPRSEEKSIAPSSSPFHETQTSGLTSERQSVVYFWGGCCSEQP